MNANTFRVANTSPRGLHATEPDEPTTTSAVPASAATDHRMARTPARSPNMEPATGRTTSGCNAPMIATLVTVVSLRLVK